MKILVQIIDRQSGLRCQPFEAERSELAKELLDVCAKNPKAGDDYVLVIATLESGTPEWVCCPVYTVASFSEYFAIQHEAA